MKMLRNIDILLCEIKQINIKGSLFILILLFLNTNKLFSQEIHFKWDISPSFGNIDGVIFEKQGHHCYLQIIKNSFIKSSKKKIQNEDFDNLITFLDNYEFPNKQNNEICDTIRIYYETKFLPDTNWVYANGDSLLLKKLPYSKRNYYYEFDKKLKKCYCEYRTCHTFTDGTNYKGEYIKPNIIKYYGVISARLSINDYKLNMIVLKLVRKYCRKADCVLLKKLVEKDKPILKNK